MKFKKTGMGYGKKFVSTDNPGENTVLGRGLFAPEGYLDFCVPSPNTHSWVKIKKSVNSCWGSMTKKRGIFTDNI